MQSYVSCLLKEHICVLTDRHTDAPPSPLKFNTVSQESSRVVQNPHLDCTILIIKASEVPVGNREPRKKSSRNLKSTSSEVMRL